MNFDDEMDLEVRHWPLLAPFADDLPAGLHPRFRSIHTDIRNARAGERGGSLRPVFADENLVDWGTVETLAADGLSHYSKDLQLAIWYAEALTKTRGLEGLIDGLFVVRRLIELFWNSGLHPIFEEDEEDDGPLYWEDSSRATLLDWFDSEIAAWVNVIPFTPEINATFYSLSDWLNSEKNLQAMTGRFLYEADRVEELRVSLEMKRALASAPPSFIADSRRRAEAALVQIGRLQNALQRAEAPISFRRGTAALRSWQEALPAPVVEASPSPAAPVPQQRPLVPPTPVEDSVEATWRRALDLVRKQRHDLAGELLETVFNAASCERDRFFRKYEFAKVLFEVQRFDLAIAILQLLQQQVELYQLQNWERSNVAVQVWRLLYDCYQRTGSEPEKARELEARLIRVAPWTALR